MFRFVRLCFGTMVRLFRARRGLLPENLALRQQLTVLKRRRPRPGLHPFDKLVWVAASRISSGWKQSLIVLTPETVERWHRAGFRCYCLMDVPSQDARRLTADADGSSRSDSSDACCRSDVALT